MRGRNAVHGEQMVVGVLIVVVNIRDRDQDQMTALPHRAERRDERLKAFERGGPAKSDDQVPIARHAIALQGGTDLPFCQQGECGILNQNTGRIRRERGPLKMVQSLKVGCERGTEIGNKDIGCGSRQG